MARSSNPQTQTAENIEKELLFKEMINQVANLQKRFQSEGEDDERRWMIANTSDLKVTEFLKESSVIMLHVIDAIGELEPVNGITISKQFGIPRGSVSKITRRLLDQKIVKSEFLPDNKKEVLFQLTELGQHVFKLHKQLHSHIEHNVRIFLRRYDIEQMRFLVQCMKDTAETSWVQGDFCEEETEMSQNNKITPMIPESVTQEAIVINEILFMLKQLDGRNLMKAKELIRVALFD